MTETPPDHENLARLNAEISRETDRIADLQHRIRVIEVEVAGWKMPPDASKASEGHAVPAFAAFMAALLGTTLLGAIVAAVIRQ